MLRWEVKQGHREKEAPYASFSIKQVFLIPLDITSQTQADRNDTADYKFFGVSFQEYVPFQPSLPCGLKLELFVLYLLSLSPVL